MWRGLIVLGLLVGLGCVKNPQTTNRGNTTLYRGYLSEATGCVDAQMVTKDTTGKEVRAASNRVKGQHYIVTCKNPASVAGDYDCLPKENGFICKSLSGQSASQPSSMVNQ